MSAQQIFKSGYWHVTKDCPHGQFNTQLVDFAVRKFPFDFCNHITDFMVNYTGLKDSLEKVTWVEGDCDQKFVMEISDHTRTGMNHEDKESATKEYLDIVINNPNAMFILSNITEPASVQHLEILGYLADNMDHKDFANRVLVIVPDQNIIYLYREQLSQKHNYYDNLTILDYAGHLVNYTGLKICDHTTKTTYPEPRRVGLLNGQHKPFRLYICYKLWQAGLLDKMQVTYWHKFGYSDPKDIPIEQLKKDLEMIEEKALSYHNIDPGFDEWLRSLPACGGAENLGYHCTPEGKQFPWCLNESPIQVIPETLFDRSQSDVDVFITEKIYRAMLTGKAFLPMAQPGTLDKLHSMGFKTFDRWWPEQDLEFKTDHHDVDNNHQRYEALTMIVDDIYKKSDAEFQTMLTEMKPTLLHNQNLMKELIDHQDRNRIKIFTKVFDWINHNE